MRIVIVPLFFLLLAGCASTFIPPVPSETSIPVGVPCLTIDMIPVKPDFVSDAQLAAKPDGQFVLSLASDRLARRDYEKELEAVLFACVQAIPSEGVVVPSRDAPSAKSWWKFW